MSNICEMCGDEFFELFIFDIDEKIEHKKCSSCRNDVNDVTEYSIDLDNNSQIYSFDDDTEAIGDNASFSNKMYQT